MELTLQGWRADSPLGSPVLVLGSPRYNQTAPGSFGKPQTRTPPTLLGPGTWYCQGEDVLVCDASPTTSTQRRASPVSLSCLPVSLVIFLY